MSNGKVRLTGRLICTSPKEVAILRAHLPDHIRLTRAEPGCLSFTVEATSDPMIWRVEECFQDRDAFAHHQTRTRASAWWAATTGIVRDYQILDLD